MEALNAYIASQPHRTDTEWAEFFGTSRPHFNLIRRGKSQPGKDLIERMAVLTKGAVPVESWFSEAAQVRRRRRAA